MLEAFVYDPLVDWTADRADDETRRNILLLFSLSFLIYNYIDRAVDMELMVMLSLGRTRLEESKGALRSWRDSLLEALLPFVPTPSFPGIHPLLDQYLQLLLPYQELLYQENVSWLAMQSTRTM